VLAEFRRIQPFDEGLGTHFVPLGRGGTATTRRYMGGRGSEAPASELARQIRPEHELQRSKAALAFLFSRVADGLNAVMIKQKSGGWDGRRDRQTAIAAENAIHTL